MHRAFVLFVAAAVTLGAGCLRQADGCWSGERESVWHFGPQNTLRADASDGSAPANGFVEAFLTDSIAEWRSPPLEDGLLLTGNVTLEYWVRYAPGVAPIVLGRDPGEGYHAFNQFGSERGFMPAFAIENGPVLLTGDEEVHVVEVLQTPPGGFVYEPGDHVRVLLTNLVLDLPGEGTQVLFGPERPSHVRFTASCRAATPEDAAPIEQSVPLLFAANQGLLTGAVPPSPLNHGEAVLEWDGDVDRITFELRQGLDANPVKDDIDMTILADGTAWNGGSPYADETVTLWHENLAALWPDGRLRVSVDSYSGVLYMGSLRIVLEGEVEDFTLVWGSG